MLTDVIKLWDELAEESKSTGRHLERLVRPDSEVEVVLGYGAGRFGLDITAEFPLGWEHRLRLPNCVRCTVNHIGDRATVRFQFGGGELESIFIWFSQDVANRLDGAASSDAPERLRQALIEWEEAFRVDPQKGLSRQAQQGLFAELFFMEEALVPEFSEHALLAWHSQNSVHDFQINQKAWEVKSYGGRRMEVRISSEDQLDSVGLDHLVLVAVGLKVSDEAGQSIVEIVDGLTSKYGGNAELIRHLKTGLAKYGYIDESSIVREYFFTPRRMSEYLVTDEFPRIVRMQLPTAINNVNYQLSLASLESHMAKPTIEY